MNFLDGQIFFALIVALVLTWIAGLLVARRYASKVLEFMKTGTAPVDHPLLVFVFFITGSKLCAVGPYLLVVFFLLTASTLLGLSALEQAVSGGPDTWVMDLVLATNAYVVFILFSSVLMDLRYYTSKREAYTHELSVLATKSHLQKLVILFDKDTEKQAVQQLLAASTTKIVWIDSQTSAKKFWGKCWGPCLAV